MTFHQWPKSCYDLKGFWRIQPLFSSLWAEPIFLASFSCKAIHSPNVSGSLYVLPLARNDPSHLFFPTESSNSFKQSLSTMRISNKAFIMVLIAFTFGWEFYWCGTLSMKLGWFRFRIFKEWSVKRMESIKFLSDTQAIAAQKLMAKVMLKSTCK